MKLIDEYARKETALYEAVNDNAKRVLNELKKYMQYPEISIEEFLTTGDIQENRKVLGSQELADELEFYLERIKANKEKGLSVEICQGDIREFLRFSFNSLDSRLDERYLPAPSRGRRVYTGQTEQPGPNPGFYEWKFKR